MFFLQMSGFPGSGKSTLAKELASRTGAVIIDHDVSKTALLDSLNGTDLNAKELGRAAYAVDWAFAEFQLAQGQSVIFDSPCLYAEMIRKGTDIAQKYSVSYKYIECYLNDFIEINNRLENRQRLPSQIRNVESESIFTRALAASQKPEGHAWLRVDAGIDVEKCLGSALQYLLQ
jgi:predicted kinase